MQKVLDLCGGSAERDTDLDRMTQDELIAEVTRLRHGCRSQCDRSGPDWGGQPAARWGCLRAQPDSLLAGLPWPLFLHGFLRYLQSLEVPSPHVPRTHTL